MRLLLVSGSVFPKSTSLADRYLILIPNIQRLVVQVCDLSRLFNKSYGFTNRKPPTSTANHQLQQPTTNSNSQTSTVSMMCQPMMFCGPGGEYQSKHRGFHQMSRPKTQPSDFHALRSLGLCCRCTCGR